MKARTVLTLSLCSFLALLGSPASAEILYDREGIQLHGTARIVSRNAATCNVLEEKYSPEEYQKMKANQGQPLHVWQLDISAHNLTGKPLDFLSATFNIESPWAALHQLERGGPRRRFLGGLRRCRRPAPARLVGRRLEGPLHALWHARSARSSATPCSWRSFTKTGRSFKNWYVHFTFARQRSQGQQAPAAPSRAAPRQRVELPPEILADKYLRQAEQLVQEKDYEGARQALEKLLALQQEHGLEPDPEDHFPLRPDLVGGGGAGAGHGGGGALPADPGPGGRALRGGPGPDQTAPKASRPGPRPASRIIARGNRKGLGLLDGAVQPAGVLCLEWRP